MTVEDLIEALRNLPLTARVVVRIDRNVGDGGELEVIEFGPREHDIDDLAYARGEVVIVLDEQDEV